MKNQKARYDGAYGKAVGDENQALVLAALRLYPGIKNTEISQLTGIGVCTVGKHVNRIRAEWLDSLN